MMKTHELFDLSHTIAGAYLAKFEYPWDALAGIHDLILTLGSGLGEEYRQLAPNVWVHNTASVAPTASVTGPCIIGPWTEVRHCAYIRGSVLIGENCVVSNSSELKNAIIFDDCQVPHFNYVGDSIMGYHTHVGAGTITSNLKTDHSPIVIRWNGESYPTGRKKFGAMIGDYADVGAGTILNPGTIVGRRSRIYPHSTVRGVVPENHIYKSPDNIVPIR